MKKILMILMVLGLLSISVTAQNSQCIFSGSVEIRTPPDAKKSQSNADVVEVWLLKGDSAVRKANFNADGSTYGVSAFSNDGFADGDMVSFRIVLTDDTILARTSGDAPKFYGTVLPNPPDTQSIRTVNLYNNYSPYINSTPVDTAWEDYLYQYQVSASDEDNDTLTYSLLEAPSWLSIDAHSGLLHGTPGASDVGIVPVTIEVDDGYFHGSVHQKFSLTVVHTNHPPQFTVTIPDTIAREDFLFQYQVWASDVDNDSLSYGINYGPSWLSIDEGTGLMHGTPGASDVRFDTVTVSVYDETGAVASRIFILHVLHTNHPPARFHLLAPANRDTINSSQVHFQWRKSIDPDPNSLIWYGLVLVGSTNDTIARVTTDTTAIINTSVLHPLSFYRWTVFSSDSMSYSASLDTFSFFVTEVLGVQPAGNGIPDHFSLAQNYPNPFNPATDIQFAVRDAGFATLTIYDMLGREVQTLVNEMLEPGTYHTQWNANNLPSGAYYYRITIAGRDGIVSYTGMKKAFLIK